MLRALKLSLLAVIALFAGCALPLEEHGGAAPRPEASDLTFIGGGAALNESLILARVPWQGRIAADAAAVWALRFPKWGGRNEGVALTVPFGAYLPEFVRFIVVHSRHPACQYAGADGVVHAGHLYHEECI